MSMDGGPPFASAGTLARMIASKQISPVEVLDTHLARIAETNPHLNALVTVDEEGARKSARSAEKKLMQGRALGPLHGVPFTLKDVYDAVGIRTTWGSQFYADRVPRKAASVARRLKAAGAVLLGKGNCPEFAYALYTDNRVFGPTRNPWDTRRTPGGSSGGDAAAVASFMTPLGIGSDLGGSIRAPAHCCGIYGFIAAPGRVSNEGHCPAGTPLAGALVRPGFLARSVEDLALALGVAEGFNYLDAFSTRTAGDPVPLPLEPATGLKCAVLDFDAQIGLSGPVAGALETAARILAEGGGRVRAMPFALADQLAPTWRTLVGTGMKFALEAQIGSPYPEDSLTLVKDVDIPPSAEALQGLLAAYGNMLAIRMMANMLLMQVDVLVMPILAETAFGYEDGAGRWPSGDRQVQLTQASFLAILAGLPAIAVPMGRAPDGLPFGVQLVAAEGNEGLLLRAGATLERAHPFDGSALATGVRVMEADG